MKHAAFSAAPIPVHRPLALSLRRLNTLVAAPVAALTVIGACTALTLPLSHEEQVAAVREGGPIELATGAALLVAAALLVMLSRLTARFTLLSAFAVCLIAAREFDLHKLFTSDGVLKTAYYTNPEIPQWEKITALLVLGALALTLGAYVRLYWRGFLGALRERRPAAWTMASGVGLFIAGRGLDRAFALLEPLGVAIAKESAPRQVFEEVFELAGAVLLLLAVAQYAVSHVGVAPREPGADSRLHRDSPEAPSAGARWRRRSAEKLASANSAAPPGVGTSTKSSV